MRAHVAGVKRAKGEAKSSGVPFDMPRVLLLTPITAYATAKMSVTGVGFELMEVPVDVDALPKFEKLSYPCWLDLVTEPRPRFGKFETVVVDFATVTPATGK